MPILNYARPQHQISLRLQETSAGATPRALAGALGNQFLLNKLAPPETVYGAASANQLLTYRYAEGAVISTLDSTKYTVDVASVRMIAKDLEARLAVIDGGTAPTTARGYVPDLAVPSVVRMGAVGSHDNFAGGSLAALLLGRDTKVGDVCYVTFGGNTRRRVVTGLIGAAIASSFGSNSAANDSLAANAAVNPVTQASDAIAALAVPANWTVAIDAGEFVGTVEGATYLGKHGDAFTLTVLVGGLPGTATVSLSSDSGLFSASSILTVDDAGDFNVPGVAGLTVRLEPPGGTTTLTAAQTFRFSVLGAYTPLSATNTRLVAAGTYTGAKDTTFVAKVVTGTTGDTATGAVLEITDTTGLLASSQVTLTNNVAANIGLGVTLKFSLAASPVPQAGLRKGDIYTVVAKAATNSTTDFDRITLDGPAVDLSVYTDPAVAVSLDFRTVYTGEVEATASADGSAWSSATAGVTLQSGLALYDSERDSGSQWVPFVNGVGTVAIIWRALKLLTNDASYVTIDSESDITTKLGVIDIDNDLAYGAWRMFAAAGGNRVLAMNIGGNTAAHLTEALRRISSNDSFVYINLCSNGDDETLFKQLVAAHCIALSAPDKKMFRKAYGGTDLPGSYKALGVNASTTLPYTATVLDAGGGSYTLVTHTDDDLDFRNLELQPGDLYKSLVSGVSYEIDEVLSASEIRLRTGPGSAVVVAQAFELWYADTVASQIRYVQRLAAAISTEYFTNVVHVGNGLSGGDVISARFTAAEMAGLRSFIVPQVGLTGQEVSTVTSLPASYTRFIDTELDTMAAAGNTLIVQDAVGLPCYIRHQLTTETDKGELYYEDNALAVMFRLGFTFKDTYAKFVGRKNVNRRTLALMEKTDADILDAATKESLASPDDGPLIAEYRNLSVTQDPTFRNRVRQSAEVGISLPLGVIYTDLLGYVNVTAAN